MDVEVTKRNQLIWLLEKKKALLIKLMAERIKKVGGEYVVYPKDKGKRLGTHPTKKAALKQLAAIELNK